VDAGLVVIASPWFVEARCLAHPGDAAETAIST
jgi:hypothetical protein